MKTSVMVVALAGALGTLPAWGQTQLTQQTQLGCDRSYGLRADVDTSIGQVLCVSKADTMLDQLKNFSLSNLSYTQTSAASVQARFSDVGISLSYARNSNTLSYRFAELGVSGSFTGTNRSDAQDQFVQYVKKSDILGQIMNYQAKHSATSPITGVAGSIPMAGQADFDASFDTVSQIGFSASSTATAPGTSSSQGNNNLIGIGVSYGSYNVSGSGDKVKSTMIPLSYTIRNDIDPRRQLVFSMPLALVQVGDADSYNGGFGVAYRFPVSDQWTLTPGGKYSIVASKDRATVSTVMSASLMSTYVIPLPGYALAIGNMLGYYKTGKFSSRDYSFDPDVALTMTRNGLLLSTPASFISEKMAMELSLIDTRYIGDKPFVASTQEIGVTIGTNRNAGNARSFTRAGISYVRGKDTRGFNINLGYWF